MVLSRTACGVIPTSLNTSSRSVSNPLIFFCVGSLLNPARNQALLCFTSPNAAMQRSLPRDPSTSQRQLGAPRRTPPIEIHPPYVGHLSSFLNVSICHAMNSCTLYTVFSPCGCRVSLPQLIWLISSRGTPLILFTQDLT